MQTKICSKCHQEKELSEFHKQNDGKFGVRNICKLCQKTPRALKRFLTPEGFKICSVCDEQKLLIDFYPQKGSQFGVNSKCKICQNKASKDYNDSNLERRKQTNLNYKSQAKNNHLNNLYNISLEDYNRMFQEQNGVCAICGKEENTIDKRSKLKRALAVDHDHKTGKVRGLLCTSCNNGIGRFNENIDNLQKAIDYLKSKG